MKPKIKFCGLTQKDDVKAGIELGADYLGFIFYPKSPRFISFDQAKEIISNEDFKTTLKVGVFVDKGLEEIALYQEKLALDVIQLHNQKKVNLNEYKKKLPVKEIWPVIRPRNKEEYWEFKEQDHDFFLLDKYNSNLKGGVGKAIDWAIVKPWLGLGKKIILAGGIDLARISLIIDEFKKNRITLNETLQWDLPYAFDCNSKIELKPGLKDQKKMVEITTFLKKLN